MRRIRISALPLSSKRTCIRYNMQSRCKNAKRVQYATLSVQRLVQGAAATCKTQSVSQLLRYVTDAVVIARNCRNYIRLLRCAIAGSSFCDSLY
jgi:hypothetical protein